MRSRKAPAHQRRLAACGLSPRVRGNQHEATLFPKLSGSIPACTGEPFDLGAISVPLEVYPRVYGGTGCSAKNFCGCTGLSPRVRGNRGGRRSVLISRRSIPACTGEPLQSARPSRTPMVYPRVCGGTTPGPSDDQDDEGLSPRVRGNQFAAKEQAQADRSIPACAGEPNTTKLC